LSNKNKTETLFFYFFVAQEFQSDSIGTKNLNNYQFFDDAKEKKKYIYKIEGKEKELVDFFGFKKGK
jgi:hypothetical protein